MHFDVVITKEKGKYVSWCPQLDVSSFGGNLEEARENLKEAIELYLEDEDAHIPKDETSITLTSLEVKTNEKASRFVR